MFILDILLEEIRSAYNVGSIFRTAESAAVNHIYLTGRSVHPPNPKLSKTALGAQLHINWQYFNSPDAILDKLKNQDYSIIGLEPTKTSISIYNIKPSPKTCLVFGNELTGISRPTLKQCSTIAKIPLYGTKSSLNVASAAAIAIYQWKQKHFIQK